jgi:serine phosphatase RsbU (regulator of sigma subunit)
MPFQALNARTQDGIEVFPAHFLHRGETVSGDAVFVETGRTDDRMMLLVVDVMGHESGASEVMTDFRQRALGDVTSFNLTPAELLQTLNRLFGPIYQTSSRFMTGLALLIDGRNGTLEAATAGQPVPWVGVPGSAWAEWPLPPGSLLGLGGTPASYQSASRTLASGECVLAFSDGVSEAGAMQGNQFQHGFLQHFLASLSSGLSSEQIIDGLMHTLRAHVPTGWPQDDTIAVCVRRL